MRPDGFCETGALSLDNPLRAWGEIFLEASPDRCIAETIDKPRPLLLRVAKIINRRLTRHAAELPALSGAIPHSPYERRRVDGHEIAQLVKLVALAELSEGPLHEVQHPAHAAECR